MDKNHFNLYRFSLVCLSLLLLALPALSAANSLEIKCQDSAGNPIVAATVQIQPLETLKWKGDKKSDAKGIALFNKLDDGAYRILARKEGFAPAFYEFAVMKGGSSQSVTLKLEPGDTQKKLYFEDPALGQKASDLLNDAIALLRSNKLPDAEKQLKAALDINPSNALAQFYLAIAYIQQEKWDLAEATLQSTSHLIGILNSLPKPKDAAQPATYDEIGGKTNEILTQLPSMKIRSEGNKLLSERKFDLAAQKYAEVLKTQTNDPDLYYNLALAQANGHHFDEAMQSIDKAIQLNEIAYADLKKKIGDIKENDKAIQLKSTENAYADLKKKIGDFQENEILNKAQGLLEKGDELAKTNDYAGAMAKYQEALKTVPNIRQIQQAVVLAKIASTHAKLNHSEQAVAAWQKAIEYVYNDPVYKDALDKLSAFKKSHPVLQPGEAEKLSALEAEAAKLKSRADAYRNELAQFYMKEKKYDEALNIYADASAAGNQPVDQVLFKLGQAQSNQDNSEVAQLAFERAIKANPQNAEAYYELGMLLYQGKKADKQATEMLTKYVEIGKDAAHIDNAKTVLVVLKRRMK
jgi:tetratricopeptide (TPR) repeat protein